MNWLDFHVAWAREQGEDLLRLYLARLGVTDEHLTDWTKAC